MKASGTPKDLMIGEQTPPKGTKKTVLVERGVDFDIIGKALVAVNNVLNEIYSLCGNNETVKDRVHTGQRELKKVISQLQVGTGGDKP